MINFLKFITVTPGHIVYLQSNFITLNYIELFKNLEISEHSKLNTLKISGLDLQITLTYLFIPDNSVRDIEVQLTVLIFFFLFLF